MTELSHVTNTERHGLVADSKTSKTVAPKDLLFARSVAVNACNEFVQRGIYGRQNFTPRARFQCLDRHGQSRFRSWEFTLRYTPWLLMSQSCS